MNERFSDELFIFRREFIDFINGIWNLVIVNAVKQSFRMMQMCLKTIIGVLSLRKAIRTKYTTQKPFIIKNLQTIPQ